MDVGGSESTAAAGDAAGGNRSGESGNGSPEAEEPGPVDGSALAEGGAAHRDGSAPHPADGGSDEAAGAGRGNGSAPHPGAERARAAGASAVGRSRRPPRVTTDTARPEGGGRAAPGDAPAPARQWPLLTVLGMTALGLLIVGTSPFPQAFRIGTMLIGVALLTGAVLRRTLPSVGMLAVRSRFTDMVTYGLLGVIIVLLSLMVQPRPWLEIPFLEDALHVTVT
ncbi:DUF3017 domain-containing protein [Streptomyces purpureus]